MYLASKTKIYGRITLWSGPKMYDLPSIVLFAVTSKFIV
jgi:hypothetical protein